jgi:hypothetical protein
MDWEEQAKKVRASSAPSLNITKQPWTQRKPEPPPPTILEVAGKEGATRIRVLVEEYAEQAAIEKAAGEAKARISEELKQLCSEYGVAKAVCGDWKVSHFQSQSSTVSKDALLENGVDEVTIRKSTLVTKFWALRVTPYTDPTS